MEHTYIDVHILQTVPPSNVNRDDTGSPKSALYGGVRRARVSSQAWKRATRQAFEGLLDTSELGVRTTRLVELLAEQIRTLSPALNDTAERWAEKALTRGGIKLEKKSRKKGGEVTEEHMESGYLVFLSRRQIERLAEAIVEVSSAEPDPDKGVKEINAKAILDTDHSVDLALFGRMVADVSDLSLDAAAQVAHAISTHAVDTEYDYFTAVDDEKKRATDEDAGAGMIGTVEFNSSTLYRYATVNVPLLAEHLGNRDATRRAVEAFVRAFATSMPTGKQNTFANRTLPDAIVVCLRHDQPVNLVGAFEEPIANDLGSGYITASANALATHIKDVSTAYANPPASSWVVAIGPASKAFDSAGERTDFDGLISALGQSVVACLGDE